ncbi:MAG: hypothetical protein ACLR9T_05875 [Thomasclavelia sp.]
MKEKYEVPEIEVIKFNTEDVILMSGLGDNDGELPPDWGGIED